MIGGLEGASLFSGTSQAQQSLHRLHLSQRCKVQASLVHQLQISIDASSQILQWNERGPLTESFSPYVCWLGGRYSALLCFLCHDFHFCFLVISQIKDVLLQLRAGFGVV